MKAKISIAVIVILAVVGLLWINRPTVTIQNVSATPTAEPTPEPTTTPEPTVEPTAMPEPTAEATPTPEAVQEEVPVVEATPAPTITLKPNVTVKTEEEKRAETSIPSEADLWKELGFSEGPQVDEGTGLLGTSGNGTHFGDAQ